VIAKALIAGSNPLVAKYQDKLMDGLQALRNTDPQVIEILQGYHADTGKAVYKAFSNVAQLSAAIARVTHILQCDLDAIRLQADQSDEAVSAAIEALRASIPAVGVPDVQAA
jgi:hypothetical protein